jgi:hypothetical protein
MKKLLLVVAFGAAGLVSAKNADLKKLKLETIENISLAKNVDKKVIFKYYNPVRLESSCGYVQYITLTSQDNPSCLLVELADMEDFCNASVDGEWQV